MPLHGLASDDVPIGDVAPAETADDQALGSKGSSASAFESDNHSNIPMCVDTTVSCEPIFDVTIEMFFQPALLPEQPHLMRSLDHSASNFALALPVLQLL